MAGGAGGKPGDRPEAGQADAYTHLQLVLTKPLDWELVHQQYDQMVKYTTALRLGTAETEAILRRFTRTNVQHPTYKAFAELGKASKTIFLCRYLHSEALRREINEGLNVIEQWNGAVASVVVTMQDLAPLQALERMRAEFLGMVSHELRVPLTSIKGSTAAALGAARLVAPAETREFFRIIDDQADRMIGLIADLLDAGRIEAGTLSVAPEPSAVAALVDQARGTFISGGGRHAVGIDLPPDLPPVLADRQRIVQVLNNLLANAARHAPDTAAIRIAAERDGEHVAVSVADEGRGIAPEHLGQLFRKYAAAGDREGGVGGGLGLAICKGLVEAHGGRIRAESGGVGLGTRVTFTIPVAGPADAGARPRRPARRDAATDAVPILVVDDDPGTLRHVRDTLTDAGYAPLVTGDPGELSRILRTEKPRLVLLDLMLPGTDGIQLMQTVPELADLPVIFISGYGRDETIARALEAGADDYIVKPFSPTELTARIRAALRRVELTATEYELLRVLAQDAGRVLTHETLLRRVWAGRPAAAPKIVRAYVKRLRDKLADEAARPTLIVNERGVGYRMPRLGDR